MSKVDTTDSNAIHTELTLQTGNKSDFYPKLTTLIVTTYCTCECCKPYGITTKERAATRKFVLHEINQFWFVFRNALDEQNFYLVFRSRIDAKFSILILTRHNIQHREHHLKPLMNVAFVYALNLWTNEFVWQTRSHNKTIWNSRENTMKKRRFLVPPWMMRVHATGFTYKNFDSRTNWMESKEKNWRYFYFEYRLWSAIRSHLIYAFNAIGQQFECPHFIAPSITTI